MGSSHRFPSAPMADVKGKRILYEDDDEPLQLEEDDGSHTIREFRMSLIGKVLNPNKQNVEKLINSMPTQWGLQDRITANDLGNGKFLLNFSSGEDIQFVLSQGPFHYNFCMFVLVRWEPVVHDENPWVIPFWVEITGIPLYYWTVRNLKNIGKKLGHIDMIELSTGWLLVEVDTRKPLIFNKKVQFPGGDEVTIQFKYKKLFKHCSYCGFLTHEAPSCPKKMEAGVFSRVQLPFEQNTRQSLLADRTERDRYHSWNERKTALRDDRKPEIFKPTSSEAAYRTQDDRYMPRYDSTRDKLVRRRGDKRGPHSASRYSRRYAPCEAKKTQSWRAKDVRDGGSHSVQRHGGPMQLDCHKDSHNDGLQIMQLDSEPSEITRTSRNSGRKIASAIVTPSRMLSNDENITFRDRGDPRSITFSPMEKEGYKDDMERGQIIGALQDMEIGESDGLVVHQHDLIKDIEVLNEAADNLIGEELEDMEEDAVSQHIPPRSHNVAKGTKNKHSCKGSSRSLVPRGMPMRKVEFLRRGSPRKRGVSSSGNPENHKHNRHNSSKKARTSLHNNIELEGSKKPQKLIHEDTQLELRGIRNDLTVRRLIEICQKHRPGLVFLSEMKSRRLLLQNNQALQRCVRSIAQDLCSFLRRRSSLGTSYAFLNNKNLTFCS
ncbi:hypothetical protein Bca52824_065148 [Brassica carinata]|uniref:DUF4283 domain-containing protein n=1 Tax=Brassica carinata TaxID=52824 RepID=A0A8X7QIW3_BRACI|nr:hypothetical protein Bca52824_065148 [Brassica carinata]